MIPRETVDRILDTVRIEDVIGDFVSLRKKGTNYMACCPFHNEKTPSFSVSPSKGIYKCFGCGKAGTAVGFVMEHESMSYVEALRYLARKYHIEVVEEDETAEEIAKRQRNESLLLVSDYAGKFFKESLQTEEGQTVGYQYFRSRGLEEATIEKFGLGWAPSSRNAFAEKARSEGHKEGFLVDTGLCLKYEDGRLVDRFFDRVIFPIHSVSGRVIGFGGRTLRTSPDKRIAKYINSPSSEIYDKSCTLYGIYFAKTEISRNDKCILVEGYLDVLSMHQLGITNVVASSGTSLTVGQIRLIRKFTNNVTIIYDGDSAGIKAAIRGIDLVLKEGLNVKIVLLPEGMDPDDFSRKHTLEQVQDYITQNEQDFISFKTDLLLGEAGNDPLKRATLINDVADSIALIPDIITRTVYVHSCADKFEIDEQILSERVNTSRSAMLLEGRRQSERDVLRAQRYDAPVPEHVAPPPPVIEDFGPELVVDIPAVETPIVLDTPDNSLEPCEKEILGFILEHGCETLEFDRDSRFYIEGESVNVAEFIDGMFAEDNASFVNDSYRLVYDEYFRLYDEGYSQEQIQNRLLNNMDQTIVAVASDILIKKHRITVQNYENSLTSVTTRLVRFVPKSLLVYQCRKVEMMLKELTTKLASTPDPGSQEELLASISEYTKMRKRLNDELGRV